jgi:hypothetical protein
MTMHRRSLALFAALLLVVAACGGSKSPNASSSTGRSDQLAAEVASFDLAVGPTGRFLVGLFNPDKGDVGYGTVHLQFSFLGTTSSSGTPQPGATADATFLPVPGSEPAQVPPGPAFLQPSQGRGVYQTQAAFDRAGYWEVAVTADLVGVGQRSTTTDFQVLPHHLVPAVGEPAPLSNNLTVASTGAPQPAIDSRATGNQPIPDPELHQTTIAAAVAAHRPVVAVFATPVFCVSRFCGPVTDMVDGLARKYADRATFIHVEIWKDYQAKQLNDVIGEWLTRDGADGNEPWVFLIGADGKIAARWDNLASPAEMETMLQALPVIGNG